MKLEKLDGSRERRILTAMITNKDVLGKISTKWDGELFSSTWANLVASWCVTYFEKYGSPPNKSIKSMYESWSEKHKDKDSIQLVEKFLSSLSKESINNPINPELVMDIAQEYFNRVKLFRLRDTVESNLDAGQVGKAEEAVGRHQRLEIGSDATEDLFIDRMAIQTAFSGRTRPLITYPYGLGLFFSTSLQREDFVAFEGPDKCGKSFWLTDIAYRAMLQRNKVAFFECGDMSRDQLKMRFMVRVSKHPYISPGYKWPYILRYPIEINKNKNPETYPEIVFQEMKFDKPLEPEQAWRACEKVMMDRVKSKESYFKLSCHPNSSINVKGIESIMDGWGRSGWFPDVVVIDYADILDVPFGSRKQESRDQTNITWKQLRALAQKRHCLVITATQSDSDAYKSKILDRHNFSEDKRKLSHVTGMVGINVTDEEKSLGLCRLNWIVLREGEYNSKIPCYVAQCLPMGQPAVRSLFKGVN